MPSANNRLALFLSLNAASKLGPRWRAAINTTVTRTDALFPGDGVVPVERFLGDQAHVERIWRRESPT